MSANIKNSKSPLNIIFENDDFIVVVKPQNLPVQGDRRSALSLLTSVKDYFEFGRGLDDPFIELVHRLDRHTGGLCLMAKTPLSLKELNHLFASRQVEKRYLVVVKGVTPLEGHLTHYLAIDTKKNFVTAYDAPNNTSQKAVLKYQRLGTQHTDFGDISLIEVLLETGRQHQIRVQLSKIGYPVLGDPKYGTCPLEGESLALWAYSLKFNSFEFKSQPSESNLYFKFWSLDQFNSKMSSE